MGKKHGGSLSYRLKTIRADLQVGARTKNIIKEKKMMKKMFVFMAMLLLIAVPVFAGPTIQTSHDIAVANPYFYNSGLPLGNPANGGWSVEAGGIITVDSYAQGTKSAQTTSYANGTGMGIGGAAGIQTANFGLGVSGAVAGVIVDGAGYGLGKDKFSLSNNPDFASVGITYEGSVQQGNGILVSNGAGTFAGGQNLTGANFSGGSYQEDLKFGGLGGKVFDILTPALAVGIDGAGAVAGGFSTAGYVSTLNFAASGAKTVGFSAYCADNGMVSGSGIAEHQAVVSNGSSGLSYGMATFNYAGQANLGYGVAETGGFTRIQNTPNSSSVTSFSSSKATATPSGSVQPR